MDRSERLALGVLFHFRKAIGEYRRNFAPIVGYTALGDAERQSAEYGIVIRGVCAINLFISQAEGMRAYAVCRCEYPVNGRKCIFLFGHI